jgi:23S rRNA (guanosine2251-2'-O)-methyltransferase
VIFGIGPVRELVAARADAIAALWVDPARAQQAAGAFAEIVARARAAGIAVLERPRADLDEAAGAGSVHQGVIALAREFRYATLEEVVAAAEADAAPALVVALDGVTDPHNLGAIARSAYLVGAHGLIIPRDRAAEVTAVATKASAGAVEHLPIAQVTNLARALESLKEAGVWIAALDAAPGAVPIDELDASLPLCLVLGAEGSGVRPLVLRQADHRLTIPMVGRAVGSFNVSVAAGIALYEVARQRAARR